MHTPHTEADVIAAMPGSTVRLLIDGLTRAGRLEIGLIDKGRSSSVLIRYPLEIHWIPALEWRDV